MEDKGRVIKKRKLLTFVLIAFVLAVMAVTVVANFVSGATPYCLVILVVLFIAMVIFVVTVWSTGNRWRSR